MKTIAFPPLFASLLVGLALVVGCGGRNYDPLFWHENFVSSLQSQVGQKIERVEEGSRKFSTRPATPFPNNVTYLEDKYLIDIATLPNGNVIYKYRAFGTCRRIYEVDPKTDIIIAVSWKGEAKDCIIVP